jgi:hypothetical protein
VYCTTWLGGGEERRGGKGNRGKVEREGEEGKRWRERNQWGGREKLRMRAKKDHVIKREIDTTLSSTIRHAFRPLCIGAITCVKAYSAWGHIPRTVPVRPPSGEDSCVTL